MVKKMMIGLVQHELGRMGAKNDRYVVNNDNIRRSCIFTNRNNTSTKYQVVLHTTNNGK